MKRILLVMLALSFLLVSSVLAKEDKKEDEQNAQKPESAKAQATSRNLQVGDPSNPDEVSEGLRRKYQGANSQKETKPVTDLNQSQSAVRARANDQLSNPGGETTEGEKSELRINDLKNKEQTAENELLKVQQKTHETQSSVVNNIKP